MTAKPLNFQEFKGVLDSIKNDELMRLVYVSTLTFRGRIEPKIFQKIESKSKLYNKRHNITGTLCYGNSHFLQCLEGDKQEVIPLLEKIFEDNRHKNIKILLVKPINSPLFVSWDMRKLFLERWLWSAETKKDIKILDQYLPFNPHDWSAGYTEQFLRDIKQIKSPFNTQCPIISLNIIGNMIQHFVGLHQAFILVQSILTIFVIVALFLLKTLVM